VTGFCCLLRRITAAPYLQWIRAIFISEYCHKADENHVYDRCHSDLGRIKLLALGLCRHRRTLSACKFLLTRTRIECTVRKFCLSRWFRIGTDSHTTIIMVIAALSSVRVPLSRPSDLLQGILARLQQRSSGSADLLVKRFVKRILLPERSGRSGANVVWLVLLSTM
jgi:hypothetical protein